MMKTENSIEFFQRLTVTEYHVDKHQIWNDYEFAPVTMMLMMMMTTTILSLFSLKPDN